MRYLFFLVSFLMLQYLAVGQIVSGRMPRSLDVDGGLSIVGRHVSLDAPSVAKSAPAEGMGGTFPFAHIIRCGDDFMDGAAITLHGSGTLSIRAVIADGAKSLGVLLEDFYLMPGVELYLYSPGCSDVLGAITDVNNVPQRKLRTAQVDGDTLIMELYVPDGVEQPSFTIGNVYYDYVGITGKAASLLKGSACSTEVNVNCGKGDQFQALKHSVLRCITDYNNQSYFCTGSLVNSLANNGEPLVLTAAHCICTQEQAEASVFYFNYEKPVCDAQLTGPKSTISGANIVAVSDRHVKRNRYGSDGGEFNDYDFALLRLSKDIPDGYLPYFAGISLSEEESQAPVTVIHHPWGDYKSISGSYSEVYVDTYPDEDPDCDYTRFSHWHVPDWRFGTTEPGSSGAPLFNGSHQLIGVLSGGYASCSDPADDFFQMISKAWEPSSDAKHQLKHWLSPNAEVESIPPYDPLNVEQYFPRPVIKATVSADSSTLLLSWDCGSGNGPQPNGYRIVCNGNIMHTAKENETSFKLNIRKRYLYQFYVVADYSQVLVSSNLYQLNTGVENEKTPVGDITPAHQPDLLVYPNPVDELLYFKSGVSISDATVDIVDAAGRKVNSLYYGDIEQGTPYLYMVNGLKAGVYVFYLRSARHTFAQKIMVR